MQNMRKSMGKAKRFLIAAAVATAAFASTACDVDAEFSSPVVVDNISIAPNDWKIKLDGGQFEYYYFDVDLHWINEGVFKNGGFTTYWRYGDVRDGVEVDVQEPLPAVMHLSRYSDSAGQWVNYTETISCSYEVGWVRIMPSRSALFTGLPSGPLYFRTVVGW